MKLQRLNQQVSVSDQINPNDMAELAQAGVAVLVCNRPDNEAAGQPSFAEVRQAAEANHIEAVHIPFAGGELNQSHIDAFKVYLASDRRIHAYCRTGNRSTKLWEAATGAIALTPTQSPTPSIARQQFQVVIIGAGSGGVSVAASLLKRNSNLRIALVDPAKFHYYQPGWTMVGGGIFSAASTERPMASVIPQGVSWIAQALTRIVETDNKVILTDGSELYYEHLVIACGLTLAWDAIEGLTETLGKNGVTSNYRYDLAPYTWSLVQQLRRGKALFTQPPMPIKCAGAPQKAMYLSADYWFRTGVLKDIDVHFYNAGQVLFGVAAYVPALQEYIDKYRAQLHFGQRLVKVDGQTKTAWFEHKQADGSVGQVESDFDMLHVCPPQQAPDCIRTSTLVDAAGWLDVHPNTLRHQRVANIWGLGDATNTPNAKTMAAVRKQAPVLAQNLADVLAGKTPQASYDGYGSCPLTVERGKIVLAEFTYGGQLAPSFPSWLNDGTHATRFAWQLKERVLPSVYWHGMLKGREWMAKPQTLKAVTA